MQKKFLKLLISLLLMTSVKGQVFLDVRFGNIYKSNGNHMQGNFRVLAKNDELKFEVYNSSSKEVQSLGWTSTSLDSITYNEDSSLVVFYSGSTKNEFISGDTTAFKVYNSYGKLLSTYYNRKDFGVINSDTRVSMTKYCIKVTNLNTEFLVYGDENRLFFNYDGINLQNVILKNSNGRIVNGFRTARLTLDDKKQTTIGIYLKGAPVPLYQKTFIVIGKGDSLPSVSASMLDDSCAQINTKYSHSVISGKVNEFYLSANKYKDLRVSVEDGVLISYSSNIIKLKPNSGVRSVKLKLKAEVPEKLDLTIILDVIKLEEIAP